MGQRSTSRRIFGAAALAMTLVVTLSGCLWRDVHVLASDDMEGRKIGTPGAAAARSYLVKRVAASARPIAPDATGEARYTQSFGTAGGLNVVGIIPGTDLADEYVLVGAHYDHTGICRTSGVDRICNGATDNATGVAAVLWIAERLAAQPGRRSVVIALFDGEEAGLLGSVAYAASPVVPLSQTVATVTADMLGVNVLPSGRNNTFVVGEETGGSVLQDVVQGATDASALDETRLSAVMGAYRSDYASFLSKQIPTLFFSDSTGGCYHTPDDEVDTVDWDKLGQQTEMVYDTVRRLVDGADTPTWTPAPLATYDDLLKVTALVEGSQEDWGLLTNDAYRTSMATYLARLQGYAAAGPDAFPDNLNSFLSAANSTMSTLSRTVCQSFVPTTTTTPTTVVTP